MMLIVRDIIFLTYKDRSVLFYNTNSATASTSKNIKFLGAFNVRTGEYFTKQQDLGGHRNKDEVSVREAADAAGSNNSSFG